MKTTRIPFGILMYAASFKKMLVNLSELRWRRLAPGEGNIEICVAGSKKTILFELTKTQRKPDGKVDYWEYTSKTTPWKLAIFNQ